MARLLYITDGLRGGVNASLEIGARLRQHGHTISFLGYRDSGTIHREAGFDYHQLHADRLALDTLATSVESRGRLRSLPMARRLRQQFVESTEVEDAVTAIAPDGLIIDVEAHYAIVATRSLGIPTVLKSDWLSLHHDPGVPPLNSTLGYPTSLRERLRAEQAWARIYAIKLFNASVGELRPNRLKRRWAPFSYYTVSRRDVRAVAKARGLNLRHLTSFRGWLWPHTYPGLPLISSTPSELDFVRETSPNDRWIGPMIHLARASDNIDPAEAARWTAFRDANAASRDRPLIYCSFGTLAPDTAAMIRRVLAVFEARPDWDLVVGMGGRIETVTPSKDVSNVLVLEYAPQLEVLAAADIAILHGGINGILECLHFEVPMILERSGPFDQPGTASRAEYAGIGTRADLASIEPAVLEELIANMLSLPEPRQRLSQLKKSSEAYKDDLVVERIVDRLVGRRISG